MTERLNPRSDPVSILAFIFGAAVVVPSLIVLVINLFAVGKILF